MKFIPHFSVFCANIGFFCETTKFLEEFFQLNVFHQYCVSTISQVVTSIRFFEKSYFVSALQKISCTRLFESQLSLRSYVFDAFLNAS